MQHLTTSLYFVTPCKFNKRYYPELVNNLVGAIPDYAKYICISSLNELTRYFAKFRRSIDLKQIQIIRNQFAELS